MSCLLPLPWHGWLSLGAQSLPSSWSTPHDLRNIGKGIGMVAVHISAEVGPRLDRCSLSWARFGCLGGWLCDASRFWRASIAAGAKVTQRTIVHVGHVRFRSESPSDALAAGRSRSLDQTRGRQAHVGCACLWRRSPGQFWGFASFPQPCPPDYTCTIRSTLRVLYSLLRKPLFELPPGVSGSFGARPV